MERLAEVGSTMVGERRTVTVTDYPQANLNVLPRLTAEKEAERVPN